MLQEGQALLAVRVVPEDQALDLLMKLHRVDRLDRAVLLVLAVQQVLQVQETHAVLYRPSDPSDLYIQRHIQHYSN